MTTIVVDALVALLLRRCCIPSTVAIPLEFYSAVLSDRDSKNWSTCMITRPDSDFGG
jgi:hypothetical protein